MPSPIQPPRRSPASFLHAEPVTSLDGLQADIAFLGVPYAQAYSYEELTNDQTNGPTALRAASARITHALERHDFDLGGPLYDGRPIRTVDCGDVRTEVRDPGAHSRYTEQAVRGILAAGAMPIVLGGDHGVPIPVLRAFDQHGPVTLIQIDQHIDWRDEVGGVREGLSSPIRRASEMPHVGEIFQIGLRATGSARPEEVQAAEAYGAHLITAREVHRRGMDAVLAQIPDGGRYYLTVDLDGMDPSIAPAVMSPCPGGITFDEACTLIHGLVQKGRVIGMDVVEIAPKFDVNEITCITAGRLIVNMIGAAVRAGYFDR